MSAAALEQVPLLEVRGLTKRFPVGSPFGHRELHAVEDVSFTARRGRVVAIVGESGSGKTTTIRMIARLVAPTAGEILLDGIDLLKSEHRGASLAYRRRVQYIFQDPFASLNPVHTIAHHLERPLLIHGVHRGARPSGRLSGRPGSSGGGSGGGKLELAERVRSLLELVELKPAEDIARRYPHQLSGGQRQRVAIARALAVNPELVLADEPISMLDVSIRMGVLNLIEALKTELGLAFVYITHDLASARYVGDEILVMYAGHLVEGGACEEFMTGAAHPYSLLLLSSVPDPRAGLRRGADIAARGADPAARGELPSLLNPAPGCPFAARCPRVMPVCRVSMPPKTSIAPDHWLRCHLYG